MTTVYVFTLGAMFGAALPYVYFAVDSRRTKRRSWSK